ncbi:MAG: hypothetical protein Faunusvirus1_3 [Faunusvirus sp.]|jgi:hypothetical protein|uniref:Uncharacterized protein n=1 Tax=Faunusvirus sp. TaxID=2487766 RepID=A0A3G4ZZH6_9VIRU|nr:MAG: hypothetical protein Faunusvirus1_3 [Faunusvirus sp.]
MTGYSKFHRANCAFLFIYSYYIRIARSCINKNYNELNLERFTMKYTYYVWSYLVCFLLMPEMHKRHCIWFIHNTAFGLFFGIEWMWLIDRYKALFEIGHKWMNSRKAVIATDIFIHLTPLLISTYWLRRLNHVTIPVGSGVVTGVINVMYCYLIRGDFDPSSLYNITKRDDKLIVAGWTGLFASHCIGEIIARKYLKFG